MAIRAVHIEKLHSLDADSFINALMRFIARRGVPEKIRSDNGTNSAGGNNALQECFGIWNTNDKIRDMLLIRQIK